MIKVIRYHALNGEVPSFILNQTGDCAGQFQNLNDRSLIGLGDVTGAEEGVYVFASKEELITYLQTYLEEQVSKTEFTIDIPSRADYLWNLTLI